MLWDKGVGEYVQAAQLLKKRGIKANFYLLGFLESENPSAISRSQMDEWIEEGSIFYLGAHDKVADEITKSDCIVLPSYREGTPRTLLEAAAMARPIVTTDSIGCREVVEQGVNGLLCKIKSVEDLASALTLIVDMTLMERTAMGLNGRRKVECEFDESIVINKYLEAIQSIGINTCASKL